MAKKEKKNIGKEGTSNENRRSPEESGEVKGPMGIGGIDKPESRAKIRKPSKGTVSPMEGADDTKAKNTGSRKRTADPDTPPPEKRSAVLEDPAKGLPEKTSTSEEHLIVKEELKDETTGSTSEQKKRSPMKPRDPSPIILEESYDPPREADTSSEMKKENSGIEGKRMKKVTVKPTSKKAGGRGKKAPTVKKKAEEKMDKEQADKETSKPAAKKMARQKPVEGISAEEKTKLPNTTDFEDLKEKAKTTTNELMDKLIPDPDTREELKEIARSLVPDPEKLKEKGQQLASNLMPDLDTPGKMADEGVPDEEAAGMAGKPKREKKTGPGQKKEEEQNVSHKPVEASLISEYDVHLFREGKHFHLYKKFGSHLMTNSGKEGVYFALWAPNAEKVHVIGDFNHWDRQKHPMKPRQDHSGIWEAFIPEAQKGSLYKYFIKATNGYEAEKGDPFAFLWENPPNTASMVWDLESSWSDDQWMSDRSAAHGKPMPMSVYEMHLGSWKRVPEDNMRSLTYRELAEELPRYLKDMGFTHVEFMPVMEHPFFGSWGYQITGYFAPSSRFGTPQDFMYLIDALHREGIGVILDWVPSHFPSDLHGLHYFDGTFLYEHQDKKKGFHPDWQSYIFNYGRNEVRSFLISNSLFWLDRYHVDGLRVDAVASMLYLDYSRKEGEWDPNEFGGRENLEAISFLKEFNEVVYREFPDAFTIAEESTAWPMVSRPTYLGGLGFGQKWMMGWMHDTLTYFQKDPVHRRHHHDTITFSTNYAFTENFMLPLSHDEVVYGKQALLNKMPGDEWNKFANLRSLYSYMFAHPGTKLLFMGGEFGQTSEWNHDSSLDWHLLEHSRHEQLKETVKTLNNLYKNEPALFEHSFTYEGYEWVSHNDYENSVISFIRRAHDPKDNLLVICNFTPVPRENYRLELTEMGNWRELFNSDDERFGGSNVRNNGTIESRNIGDVNSIALTLPPMGVLYLKKTND